MEELLLVTEQMGLEEKGLEFAKDGSLNVLQFFFKKSQSTYNMVSRSPLKHRRKMAIIDFRVEGGNICKRFISWVYCGRKLFHPQ